MVLTFDSIDQYVNQHLTYVCQMLVDKPIYRYMFKAMAYIIDYLK